MTSPTSGRPDDDQDRGTDAPLVVVDGACQVAAGIIVGSLLLYLGTAVFVGAFHLFPWVAEVL